MLKKAGIVLAASAAGLLLASPLASAATPVASGDDGTSGTGQDGAPDKGTTPSPKILCGTAINSIVLDLPGTGCSDSSPAPALPAAPTLPTSGVFD